MPRREVPNWLEQCDIFINTTRFESFGVSVMEAAATGLVIVTTNVGELAYTWKDGWDALLTPAGDQQAIADSVKRILLEQGLSAKLSGNAREKAEQFDCAMILPKWHHLLFSILNPNS